MLPTKKLRSKKNENIVTILTVNGRNLDLVDMEHIPYF